MPEQNSEAIQEEELLLKQTEQQAPVPEEMTPVISTVKPTRYEYDEPMTVGPTEPPPLLLTIGDLTEVVSLIDVLADRGTFKGPELQGVGRLRDHLVNYVNQQSEKATADKAK